MHDVCVVRLVRVFRENKRLAMQVKNFREIFEKSLVKNRAPPYYSPPAAASPATATPPLKFIFFRVLTDRKNDVIWAAHSGRNVPKRIEKSDASD